MKKEFKAFDKVLTRYDSDNIWVPDFYSYYYEEEKLHASMLKEEYIADDNILPYEGNEHLVGTSDEPDEEIRLEKGEWLMVTDGGLLIPEDWRTRRYDSTADSRIRAFNNSTTTLNGWSFAVRFKDFDPSNMEETKKHILCVKDGKIVKYKG